MFCNVYYSITVGHTLSKQYVYKIRILTPFWAAPKINCHNYKLPSQCVYNTLFTFVSKHAFIVFRVYVKCLCWLSTFSLVFHLYWNGWQQVRLLYKKIYWKVKIEKGMISFFAPDLPWIDRSIDWLIVH